MISSRNRTAPYIHTRDNAAYEYFTLGVALIPVFCYALFFYGVRALLLIMFSTAASTLTAYICDKLRGSKEYYDINSIVNGAVFAMLLPPATPLWAAVITIALTEFLFKQVWGGVGSGPVNVACMARALIELFWPTKMLALVYPGTELTSISGVITPGFVQGIDIPDIDQMYFMEIFAGKIPSMLGVGNVLLLMIAGIYLLFQKNIKHDTVFSYLITVFVGLWIFFGHFGLKYVATYMLSSGVLFVSVYLLGDIVTAPNGNKRFAGMSRVFYGVIVGLVTVFMSALASRTIDLSVSSCFVMVTCLPVLAGNIVIRLTEYAFLCHHDRGFEEVSR